MSHPRPALTLMTLGLVGALVAGCGNAPDRHGPAPASSPTAPAPRPSDSPTVRSTPASSPTPASLPSATPGSGLAGHLLAGDELPPPPSGSSWSRTRHGRAGSAPFGPCARYDVLTIGALDVVEGRWRVGRWQAAEQVASFPDATNTQRAIAVLTAWHDRCDARVDQVSATTAIVVPHGRATSYRVTTGGRSGVFSTVVVGHRVAMLQVSGPAAIHRAFLEHAARAVSAKLA